MSNQTEPGIRDHHDRANRAMSSHGRWSAYYSAVQASRWRDRWRRVVMHLMRVVVGVVGIVLLGAIVETSSAGAIVTVAPGCTMAQPTRLGGQIVGYPDNRALDAIIGVETKDAAGNTIDPTGVVRPQGYITAGVY